MAGNDNSWSSFMQSRTVRLALNTVCTLVCVSHAADGVRELMSGGSPMLIEQIGQTAYYALTIGRIVVLSFVAFAFARLTYKVAVEEDKDK